MLSGRSVWPSRKITRRALRADRAVDAQWSDTVSRRVSGRLCLRLGSPGRVSTDAPESTAESVRSTVLSLTVTPRPLPAWTMSPLGARATRPSVRRDRGARPTARRDGAPPVAG